MPNATGYTGPMQYEKVDKATIERADDTLLVIRTRDASEASFRQRAAKTGTSDKGSGRAAILALAEKPLRVYTFRELCERAAHIGARGTQGASPAKVRAGLFLHSYASPAVVICARRNENGRLVFAFDYCPRGNYESTAVELPDGTRKPFEKGDPLPDAIVRRLQGAGKSNGARKGKGKARKSAAPRKGKARRA